MADKMVIVKCRVTPQKALQTVHKPANWHISKSEWRKEKAIDLEFDLAWIDYKPSPVVKAANNKLRYHKQYRGGSIPFSAFLAKPE